MKFHVKPDFDVIVVGSGHAGCEAAHAAARMGASVGLISIDHRYTGTMSCNPSIGGVGKGHLVREIDALGGIMARAADASAIHYRMLNRSKGKAVHGPRIQADREEYRRSIRNSLQDQETLHLVTGEVRSLELVSGRTQGVRLSDGTVLRSASVVLATGTFLGAKMFAGSKRTIGGRYGERAATKLAEQIRALGLPIDRLKTGTPPRLDGATVDWSRLERQPSDQQDWTMSLCGRRMLPQLACAVTHTNERSHEEIRQGLRKSPVHSGAIEGRGPRYCPSIEDKVVRFADRKSHQIFLEPEGLNDRTIYPNGISTSLAPRAQKKFLRTIAGLERVEIIRHGYAVEYDFLDPRHLGRDLQSRDCPGLFCAGQINGTTGYEEAAAQGLVAGVNAAALALRRSAMILDRSQSYIGVMIDDLTLQGVDEPYRMLTARAEYRLHLRADNAWSRLTQIGIDLGCVGQAQKSIFEARHLMVDSVRRELSATHAREIGANSFDCTAFAETARVPHDIVEEAFSDVMYAPYVERQRVEHERQRRNNKVELKMADFSRIGGLSGEMVERLSKARPANLDEASRLRGMTPAALTALYVALRG